MFYSTQVLARKGPLGLVWMAAHLDRQLKRQQVNEASVTASVDSLLHPEAPLALRLSGQLLLGVVRIYASKVRFLQDDASEALSHIRLALRAAARSAVDLPREGASAPVEAITLPGSNDWLGSGVLLEGGAWDLDDWGADAGGGGGAGGTGRLGTLDFTVSAPSGSARMSTDLSEVFGMGLSSQGEDERFDEAVEGFEPFDLNELEVERLRAAPGSQGGAGQGIGYALGDLDTPASASKGRHEPAHEDLPEAPLEMELDLLPEAEAVLPPAGDGDARTPGAAPFEDLLGFGSDGLSTPGSVGGRRPLGDLLPTPQAELGATDVMEPSRPASPEVSPAGGGAQPPAGTAATPRGATPPLPPSPQPPQGAPDRAAASPAGVAVAAARRPRAAASRGGAGGRPGAAPVGPKRKRVVDVAGGEDATTLDRLEIRALLADRAPLMDPERLRRARAKRARVGEGGGGGGGGAPGTLEADRAAAAGAALAEAVLPSVGLPLPRELQYLFQPPTHLQASAAHQRWEEQGPRATEAEEGWPSASPTRGDGGEQPQQQRRDVTPPRGVSLEDETGGRELSGPAHDDTGSGGGLPERMLVDGADAGPSPARLDAARFDVDGHASAGMDAEAFGGVGGGGGGFAEGVGTPGPTEGGENGTTHGGSTGAAPLLPSTPVPWPDDAERLVEEQGDGDLAADEQLDDAGVLRGSVTARSRMVLRHVAAVAAAAAAPAHSLGTPMSSGDASGRRKRVAAVAEAAPAAAGLCGDERAAGAAVSLNGLVEGKGRLDACRWFYEMLVLGNHQLVDLDQAEAYGDIAVTPLAVV